METATSIENPRATSDTNGAHKPSPKPRYISWETFEKRYLTREDGHTYEWTNGLVEKTRNSMGPTQLYIHRNLIELFYQLSNDGNHAGGLLAEPDLLFNSETHKRPDFAWLTNRQINRLSEKGAIEIPAFVIEVISNNDAAQKLADKMMLYRTAGVQVVWLIYPNQQEIHVYASHNLEQMTVCYGNKICSAAPVLPTFAFEAKDVFRKEAL